MLPAPLLPAALSADWERIPASLGKFGLGVGTAMVALLLLTNAPAVWARRDPMADPARQMSAEIARQSVAEDLIVLQAGSGEEYLPFYYNRINILSTRELWYLLGGAGKGDQAVDAVLERAWHALAKGSNVWIENRVLTSGEQISDHYVFTPRQIERILAPYGEKLTPEKVTAGPETFYKLSPEKTYSQNTVWSFTQIHAGWSGVNISADQIGAKGWCFEPGNDPNLYGPPLKADAANVLQIEVGITSSTAGKAQFFFRTDPAKPYSEDQSLSFDITPGERYYVLPAKSIPGGQGTIRGIRFDPIEHGGVTNGVQDNMCVNSITLTRPGRRGSGDHKTR